MPSARDKQSKNAISMGLEAFAEDEEHVSQGSNHSTPQDDEKEPKPTADVMMSRNLKGGAAKNFNFAFSSDEEDGEGMPSSPDRSQGDDEEDDLNSSFGSPPASSKVIKDKGFANLLSLGSSRQQRDAMARTE